MANLPAIPIKWRFTNYVQVRKHNCVELNDWGILAVLFIYTQDKRISFCFRKPQNYYLKAVSNNGNSRNNVVSGRMQIFQLENSESIAGYIYLSRLLLDIKSPLTLYFRFHFSRNISHTNG